GLILTLSWRISQMRSLSLHFVDEEDHLAGADLIIRGYKLHEQIQSNHQPLVYFASAAIQKLTHPDNIFMLVRRHRQALFAYGALWSLLLVLRFRWPGLVFVLFFEFLKYGLLGNLLLMESLAVYPAVYLFAVFLEQKLPRRPELVFLGLCSFLIIFNLVPLWPWLGVLLLLLFFRARKKILWLAAGLLLPTLLLFSWYSPAAWFRETIYNNWLYAIPALNQVKTGLDWLKIIFFPFTAYATSGSLQAQFISLFFTGYLIAAAYKPKLLWLYPLLLLTNNRVLSPGAAYYEGFHLLPWLGLMIAIFSYCLAKLKLKFVLPLAIWALVLLLNKNMPYFSKTDVNYEYYVNYSTIDDFNFAVKNLLAPGDRMAVTANQPLVHWHTNTNLATRQLVYYGWEPNVPELKADYQRVFYGDNPPEIIYGGDEPKLLQEKYVSIFRHSQPTELFIRKDRFAQITDSQWAALSTRGFEPNY
ncbi:MAG: hypothetical protein U1C50_03470, partial [Patescibacteria group bacterium]|nr:hypothetical protein [Patescibacteria group bacterium]